MVERVDKERPVQNALSQSPDSAKVPPTDLEAIFNTHQQRVVRAAYRVTGSAEDAQDVLQTVFLRLARREGGSPLSDSLGNYLHRAAINAALDVVRSRKSARATQLQEVGETLAREPRENPDRQQDAGEIREQIRLALAQASPKAAEIFALRYFEGYGNHEIAKMLGTSRSTVNVILHRTRQKLREQLASYVGEEA